MPSHGPGALDENIALHILGPLSLTDLTLTRASTTLPHIFYSSRIYCCTHLTYAHFHLISIILVQLYIAYPTSATS
jgi:hypothetical protein